MVSIHGPLGYGPSTLPLRHPADWPQTQQGRTKECGGEGGRVGRCIVYCIGSWLMPDLAAKAVRVFETPCTYSDFYARWWLNIAETPLGWEQKCKYVHEQCKTNGFIFGDRNARNFWHEAWLLRSLAHSSVGKVFVRSIWLSSPPNTCTNNNP